MIETTNLKLKKYEDNDVTDPALAFNPNMDIIEQAFSNISTDAKGTKFDNATNGMTSTTVQGAIEENNNNILEVKQSVSNGKTLIASAITDKGIPTSNSDTFQTMAENIKNIIDLDMIPPTWSVGINTVTATCNAINGMFKEFRINNGEWQSSNVFSGLIGNTSYLFEGKNISGGTSTITSISPKANQAIPSVPSASNVLYNSVTITASSGCKIRFNGNLYSSPYTFTGLTELTTYSFYSIKEATTNLNEASSLILTVSTPFRPLIYGIDINEANSNPSTCVTYTDNAVGFTPLYCGNGALNYGSWGNTFVIKDNKPCVLKNGVVQYYLNPNDYTKKENGQSSDITTGNDGDVMAEFKKCYYKLWKEGNIVKFRVANYKVDSTYCCNAFLSEDGQAAEKNCMYMSTYEASSLSSRMRSLSGKSLLVSLTITLAREQAKNNGSGYQQLTLSKYVFVTMLSTLVTKSLNHQLAIGQGRTNSNLSSIINTGTMNTKGQFWGDQTTTNGMKLFHIENFYGNVSKFLDGLLVSSLVSKYKVCGPYNDDGIGYTGGYSLPTSGGYISNINCSNDNGIIPSARNGSSTTYYSDYVFQASSGTYASSIGGSCSYDTLAGPFCFSGNIEGTSRTYGCRLTYS